jgi:tetratricopeptide (TPR) repeat protein
MRGSDGSLDRALRKDSRPTMPKALRPRGGQQPRGTRSRRAVLPRDLVDEVRRATRPQDHEQVLSRLARAIELLERGDDGAAAAEAEKAKKQANRSAAVREVLGLAYYGQGRWQDAVTELKAYRRLSGRRDQNHLIADSLRGLGRPDEAVPLAEEALRDRNVPPDSKAEAVIVAASALADQGRVAEALAFLGRASTREDVSEPWTLRLWYVRGDILAKAGRRREAAAEFRKIVRHDAGAFDAAERLAELS